MTYQSNRAGPAVSGPASCSFSRPMSMRFEDTTPEASTDRPLGKKVLIKEDEDLRTIPIIAVTAFAMKGDEEKIREGGCEAYIAKPISITSFLRTVERFLS